MGPHHRVDQPGSFHELGDVAFVSIEWSPPYSFKSDEVAFGIPVHFTMQIIPNDTPDRRRGSCAPRLERVIRPNSNRYSEGRRRTRFGTSMQSSTPSRRRRRHRRDGRCPSPDATR